MGIFGNEFFGNLFFQQSEDYEGGLTEFAIKNRDENILTEFEIKSSDKSGLGVKNEIFKKDINYIQYINNYNFFGKENYKNENNSWLKEAENITNVFDGGIMLNKKTDSYNDTLTENIFYPKDEIYNNYFLKNTHLSNTGIVRSKNYSSAFIEDRNILNEILQRNRILFNERQSEEELLQSVIKQTDKKYFFNTKINHKYEFSTLNNNKNTKAGQWLENDGRTYESGNVNITLNNYSNIYNEADEESIIDSIANKIIEYAQSGAEGVHI